MLIAKVMIILVYSNKKAFFYYEAFIIFLLFAHDNGNRTHVNVPIKRLLSFPSNHRKLFTSKITTMLLRCKSIGFTV